MVGNQNAPKSGDLVINIQGFLVRTTPSPPPSPTLVSLCPLQPTRCLRLSLIVSLGVYMHGRVCVCAQFLIALHCEAHSPSA